MILLNKDTSAIVQGITGYQGGFHTQLMLDYGTKIVAGVTPGKAGERVHGVPVFDTVADALKVKKAEWSVLFVPAKFAKSAAFEALNNGLNIIIITEGIPVHDSIEIMALAEKKKLKVLGPNCPGIATPGEAKLGIIPGQFLKKGNIGIVSRSGTLTYEVANLLSKEGLGQSTIVGIGGDPVIGIDFIDILREFEKDKDTKVVVVIGEIGGDMEERAAKFLKGYKKKVVAYIAGLTAPEGKRMGHAGAIISGSTGTAKAKVEALEKAGVKVARLPSEIIKLLK